MKLFSRLSVCLTFFLLAPGLLIAQQKTALKDSTVKDSVITFVEKMQLFAKRSASRSAKDFEADKAVLTQNRIFEEVKRNLQKAKIYLNTSNDTASIKSSLDGIEKDLNTAIDGVITNKGSAQTFRNLTATAKILTELQVKATRIKVTLDLRQKELNTFRYQLDSLLSIPELFKFSNDSLTLAKYIQQIRVVAYQEVPIDSAIKQKSIHTQEMLNRTNLLVFNLQTNQEEILGYQRDMAKNTFRREFANIWDKASYVRPFKEILNQAVAKGNLTLVFYLENNLGKLFILALLVMASFLYLRSLKSIYRENNLLVNNFEGQLVLRYPFLSALLLVVNIGQFIFFSPPFILNVIFWAISCLSLTFLFHKFITRYWMGVWLLMVAFFLITAADNLILQASRVERWYMIIISLAGAIAGIFILLKGKKQDLREKLIVISIGLMTILEFGSTLANMFGRYNLSKTLLISGYLNVVVAILFLWTLRLINEGLFLAFNVYTQQDKKLFYLNFDKLGKKVPSGFYALLVFGWLILFGRNFAGFEYMVTPLTEFFVKERTLGDYTFSINGLLLFFVIMGVSVVISKIVSFFASDKHLAHDREDHTVMHGIGSWLLLIRIMILSIGLFLAIAAAGIPLDRITIVIGALGVGIGFGLQNIVNNLVSGLIIAFEKPVNVGDIVDIDGQAGTMKSVGFRSSVITTWDGADVVMPNGDLLNSHLINWSLAGNRRRVSIALGIDYDSDLDLVKTLLNTIFDEEERILKKPAPTINYDQFGSSSIDLKLYFWVKDFKEASAVKSDIIMAIANGLKENKVKIPYPQQEIFIQNLEQIKKPKK
ncbi:mechanosensitive ion channel domain-containing protein [Pedobacter frigiditerrae]|uniref:mechanosensitive ion channel domain-containing protein n=1 Tax=Pedobacter frigiditerrae TaxID=2530452 RepID=UPI00292EB480|nr:mechanosensitive ion channel domain-containing protein [Pedobacter frigiditerrae]